MKPRRKCDGLFLDSFPEARISGWAVTAASPFAYYVEKNFQLDPHDFSNHANIVTVYSVESDGGAPFLTMELVEGRRLDPLFDPLRDHPGFRDLLDQ